MTSSNPASAAAAAMPTTPPAGPDSTESQALNRVALQEMQSLLVNLTSDQQEVIILRMIADLSLAETAKVMGKNVGSVKALQRRALESLRRDIRATEVSR